MNNFCIIIGSEVKIVSRFSEESFEIEFMLYSRLFSLKMILSYISFRSSHFDLSQENPSWLTHFWYRHMYDIWDLWEITNSFRIRQCLKQNIFMRHIHLLYWKLSSRKVFLKSLEKYLATCITNQLVIGVWKLKRRS